MSHILVPKTRVFCSQWITVQFSLDSTFTTDWRGRPLIFISRHPTDCPSVILILLHSSSLPGCNYVWLIWPVNLHYCTYTHTHSLKPNKRNGYHYLHCLAESVGRQKPAKNEKRGNECFNRQIDSQSIANSALVRTALLVTKARWSTSSRELNGNENENEQSLS